MVWKVVYKQNQKYYAIKEMNKAKIIDRKSVANIINEKQILEKLFHNFIANMYYTFQDKENLYLVMNYIPGGNLRYHLTLNSKFTEIQTKFFISCLLIALEYIHEHNIIHRDIKPENLLLDDKGYLYVTDFGIAKQYTPINYKDTSGTLSYMAPEVLKGENHSFSVDFYAIGVIVYECIFGFRPYIAKSKNKMKELVMSTQAEITPKTLPEGWSTSVISFVNGLLQRKPYERLGHISIREIMKHEWLKDIDWIRIKAKSEQAFYIPKKGDNFDKKYCRNEKLLGMDTIERYKSYVNDEKYNDIFKDFEMNKVKLNERVISLESTLNSISSSKKTNICEDETKQNINYSHHYYNNNDNKNYDNTSVKMFYKHEDKISANNSIVDNTNSCIIFPCLKNKKTSCCIRKEVAKNSTALFFNPSNKCMNNSNKQKILLNKMDNSNLSFHDKTSVNNSDYNNNNKTPLDLPIINKSLKTNEKEKTTFVKKIVHFCKIGRNDENDTIRAFSIKYSKIFNHNKNNSLLLKQRTNQRNLLLLKTNKSCSNIYINNKQNERKMSTLNCTHRNFIKNKSICY